MVFDEDTKSCGVIPIERKSTHFFYLKMRAYGVIFESRNPSIYSGYLYDSQIVSSLFIFCFVADFFILFMK